MKKKHRACFTLKPFWYFYHISFFWSPFLIRGALEGEKNVLVLDSMLEMLPEPLVTLYREYYV